MTLKFFNSLGNKLEEFKPIKITIESKEEAQLFWDMMEESYTKLDGRKREIAINISNWFYNNYEGCREADIDL